MRWAARPIWHAIVQAGLLLVLGFLNPFEIVKWSETRSHELWERLHAHDYPTQKIARTGSGATGRDQVTLLYFDDGSLARQGLTRPLSPFVLQDLLVDLAQVGGSPPRAIFVDMLLTDSVPADIQGQDLVGGLTDPAVLGACATRSGPDLAPFRCLLAEVASMTQYAQWRNDPGCFANTAARIACIQTEHGIPVLFGDPRLDAQGAAGDLPSPALDALGVVAVAVPIGIRSHEYPLMQPLGADPSDRRMYLLSPAAALYAAWCGVSHEAREAVGNRCPLPPVEEHDAQRADPEMRRYQWGTQFDAPLDIEWGIGSHRGKGSEDPERFLVASDVCAVASPGLRATAVRLMRLSIAGIGADPPPSCMYSRAFPVDVIQQFSLGDAKAVIADRLVVVGGRFSDSNDVLETSVFGAVPGVHFHAMALDNLIERGAAYAKPIVPLTSMFDVSGLDLFNFAVFFGIALILALTTKALRPAARGGLVPSGRRWSALAHIGIFACGILAMGAFAKLLLCLDSFIWPDGALVPASFNLVGAVVIAFVGLAELCWAGLLPIREWLAERFSLHRLFQALRLLAGGHNLEPRASGHSPSDRSEKEQP